MTKRTTLDLNPFVTDSEMSGVKQIMTETDFKISLNPEVEKNRRKKNSQSIARMWLTEGIPFAFQSCPAIFDQMRVWIGDHLKIDPKNITIVGSARVGFSLSPKKYGVPFGPHSDLDLVAISDNFFNKIVRDYRLFKDQYNERIKKPKNDMEESLWRENIRVSDRNIKSGFIDVKKTPSHEEYETVSECTQLIYRTLKKIEKTDEMTVKPSRASIRIYKDWESAINQISLTILKCIKELMSERGETAP